MIQEFIYVPSIELYVSKGKTLLEKDHDESQKVLHSKGKKMLTVPEFLEFLKHTKENHSTLYDGITEVRNPTRVEKLDANFKVQGKDLVVDYYIFEKGKIVLKSEILDKDTLMKFKKISLMDLLENSTNQRLPSNKTKLGNLNYSPPRENSDARFGTDHYGNSLIFNRSPLDWAPKIYVRFAMEKIET